MSLAERIERAEDVVAALWATPCLDCDHPYSAHRPATRCLSSRWVQVAAGGNEFGYKSIRCRCKRFVEQNTATLFEVGTDDEMVRETADLSTYEARP